MHKNQEFLNEIYIGKKPLDRLFQLFSEFREWVLADKGLPHREKFYKELQEEMSKVFGFGHVTFDVVPDNTMNAMTIPVRFHSWAITHEKDLILVDPKKYVKLNPSLKLGSTMIIFKGLMRMLTAEEFFAVLLHEIGHSFNQAALYAFVNKAKIAKIESNKQIKENIENVEKEVSKDKRWVQDLRYAITNMAFRVRIDEIIAKTPLFHLMNANYKINAFFNNDFFTKIKNVYKTISMVFNKSMAILNPISVAIYGLSGYLSQKSQGKRGSGEGGFGWGWGNIRIFGKDNLENEFHSDNFALIYGYGKELQSSFNKMGKEMYSGKSGIKLIDNIYSATMAILVMPVSTHPSTTARVISLIEATKFEIKNNRDLSDDERKELEKTVKEMEEMFENTKKVNQDLSKSQLGMYIASRFEMLTADKVRQDRQAHDYDYGYREIAKLNTLKEGVYNMEKNQILQEVFIGKKPLDKLFSLWSQFHNHVVNSETLPYKEKFYNDLMKELKTKFGFDDIMILLSGEGTINAMTYPAYFTFEALRKERNLFLITKDSIRVNPEHKVKTVMYFFRGIMKICTPEESFAVLLHEIGHSFNQVALQAAIYEKQYELNYFQKMLRGILDKLIKAMPVAIQNLIATDPYYEDAKEKINDWWRNAIKDEKEYKKLEFEYQQSIERTKNIDPNKVKFSSFVGILALPFTLIAYPFAKLKYKNHAKVRPGYGYGWDELSGLEREFNADNFASVFGYGTELATVMPKLSEFYNKVHTGSALSTSLLRVIVLTSRLNISTHPSEYARLVSLIKHCEFELKNNTRITKEQRGILEKQIEDTKKIINDSIAFYTDVKKNPLTVRMYHNIAKDLIGKFGSDREENDYNYGYDKLEQKNK